MTRLLIRLTRAPWPIGGWAQTRLHNRLVGNEFPTREGAIVGRIPGLRDREAVQRVIETLTPGWGA